MMFIVNKQNTKKKIKNKIKTKNKKTTTKRKKIKEKEISDPKFYGTYQAGKDPLLPSPPKVIEVPPGEPGTTAILLPKKRRKSPRLKPEGISHQD